MIFANRYLERNINYPAFVKEQALPALGMVVVIPVFNEPELLQTINSLAQCRPPANSVEVFVVVNQSKNSPHEVGTQNQQTIVEIENWKRQNPKVFFQLHSIVPPPFREKHAGVGLARKTGMDEAVRRFASIDHENGVIISLDADTLLDENYLIEIEKHFHKEQRQVGATIRFKHRIDELVDERHRQGMELYETYLHYYKNALCFSGFPSSIYTIGSAFAVRVSAYVKQGGMNRKQAGEDFYFLHKLSQLGKIGEINSTCVFPSARISTRVPFGTGPVLQKWMLGDEHLRQTYSFRSFIDLKQLFEFLPAIYESSFSGIDTHLKALSPALVSFLEEDEFEKALLEIRSNSSRFNSFEKRFFLYFNAFKILKFLNFAHPRFYAFQDLKEACRQLEKMEDHKNNKEI